MMQQSLPTAHLLAFLNSLVLVVAVLAAAAIMAHPEAPLFKTSTPTLARHLLNQQSHSANKQPLPPVLQAKPSAHTARQHFLAGTIETKGQKLMVAKQQQKQKQKQRILLSVPSTSNASISNTSTRVQARGTYYSPLQQLLRQVSHSWVDHQQWRASSSSSSSSRHHQPCNRGPSSSSSDGGSSNDSSDASADSDSSSGPCSNPWQQWQDVLKRLADLNPELVSHWWLKVATAAVPDTSCCSCLQLTMCNRDQQ
jgi:hypothetical protein